MSQTVMNAGLVISVLMVFAAVGILVYNLFIKPYDVETEEIEVTSQSRWTETAYKELLKSHVDRLVAYGDSDSYDQEIILMSSVMFDRVIKGRRAGSPEKLSSTVIDYWKSSNDKFHNSVEAALNEIHEEDRKIVRKILVTQ